MTDVYIYILFAVVVTVLVGTIAKLASFWEHFAEGTRYICYEMDHADSYKEYRRWRGELRCHYLMLIPFVTEKNVMRLYNRIFHRVDRVKTEERKDNIAPLLMPSILGICLCLVCVCGMTWAWYTANIEAPVQKITVANYDIAVEVKRADGSIIQPNADGNYALKQGYYTVTLTAAGSATKSSGYCKIQVNDKTYYTQQISADSADESHSIWFNLKVKPSQESVGFVPVWGTFSGIEGVTVIVNNGNLEIGTELPSSDVPDTTPEVEAPVTTPTDNTVPAVEAPVTTPTDNTVPAVQSEE